MPTYTQETATAPLPFSNALVGVGHVINEGTVLDGQVVAQFDLVQLIEATGKWIKFIASDEDTTEGVASGFGIATVAVSPSGADGKLAIIRTGVVKRSLVANAPALLPLGSQLGLMILGE